MGGGEAVVGDAARRRGLPVARRRRGVTSVVGELGADDRAVGRRGQRANRALGQVARLERAVLDLLRADGPLLDVLAVDQPRGLRWAAERDKKRCYRYQGRCRRSATSANHRQPKAPRVGVSADVRLCDDRRRVARDQRRVAAARREQLARACRARRSGRGRAPRSGRRRGRSRAGGRSRSSCGPRRGRSSASCTCRSVSTSSALVASSSTSTGGLRRIVRAIARRCFSPPEKR